MQDTDVNTEAQIIEVDGWPAYLMPSGKIYPFVSGAAYSDDDGDEEDEDQEDEDESEDEDSEDEDSDEDEGDEELITQEEMKRIASREKKQGRRSGRNAVLKELGFDTIEDAQAALAKNKGKKKDDEGEDTDDTSEADRRKAERQRKMDRVNGRAERMLIRAGADEDDDVLEGMLVMLKLEADDDEDDIKSAVDDLKARKPGLFGTEPKKKRSRPSSDPGGRGTSKRPAPKGKGVSLFEGRHGPIKK